MIANVAQQALRGVGAGAANVTGQAALAVGAGIFDALVGGAAKVAKGSVFGTCRFIGACGAEVAHGYSEQKRINAEKAR